LGRRNWLFAGSEAAAQLTAILCSLVQTCKHLQINPFVYLRDVIERVSTSKSSSTTLLQRVHRRPTVSFDPSFFLLCRPLFADR